MVGWVMTEGTRSLVTFGDDHDGMLLACRVSRPTATVTSNHFVPSKRPLRARLAVGNEDVFSAVVVIWLSGEATVERLQLEACDIKEPKPLVLRRPPEGALRPVVERDVDSIVTDGIPNRMGDGLVLVLPIEACRDPVIEGEGVPSEPSTWSQRRRDALEGATAVGPGRQVQERAERAVDQRRRLVNGEIAHVTLAQVKLYTCLARTQARLLEHGRRRVDADHWLAGRLRNGNGHTAIPDCKLDERPLCRARKLNVERDVGRHGSRPLLVAVGKRLVPTHRPSLQQDR